MEIAAYRLYETVVSCRRPFQIATGSQDACRTLVVELQASSGHRAYGEAVPIPILTDETFEGCLQTLRAQLLPLLRGLDIWSLRDLHRQMWRLTRAKSARCAIDLAIHHLQCQVLDISLARLLGTQRSSFPTNYSIGIEELETTVELARSYTEQGYRVIKLKVGRGLETDIATVRRVSEVIPEGVSLRLDANCGWDRRTAVKVLKELESHRCPIELVEQPTPREDFLGLKFVRERTCFPIAADESIQTIHDARQLLADDCVDILNLKLMKTGGILPALEIAALARAHGCQLMIGGMVGETVLGVTAAAAVAAAANFDYADLDADILMKDSPFRSHQPGDPPLMASPPDRVWSPTAPSQLDSLGEEATLLEEWSKGP